MLDKSFKQLNHRIKNYEITHTGGELSPGYKPDVVLSKNNNYIILESEHGTSRKHFLGGLVKAAKYLSDEREGILIFVIQIKDNTNEKQISEHLRPYLKWINNLTNLKEVFVISDENYCNGEISIEIKGREFKKLSLQV